MKTNKICLVTPSLGCGGLERVITEIANHANNSSYAVYIICLTKSDVFYTLGDGIDVIMPKFTYKKNIMYKFRVFLYLLRSLYRIRPDSVLGFGEVFNPMTIISARLTFNKVYISDRSSPEKKLSFFVNFSRRALYPLADGLIAQTEKSKAILHKKKYNNNIAVIPNPLRKINDAHEKKYNNNIVAVGRLVAGKNFLKLIKIFASLDDPKDWNLIIIGSGPEKKLLLQAINTMKLQGRVTLIDAINDIDEYFSQATIFASTSLSEGFPNALSEAMAFPLACISYDCIAGPSEIISDNISGALIPIDADDLFKDKLQRLINDPLLIERYRSNSILNRGAFASESVCRRYLEFIGLYQSSYRL